MDALKPLAAPGAGGLAPLGGKRCLPSLVTLGGIGGHPSLPAAPVVEPPTAGTPEPGATAPTTDVDGAGTPPAPADGSIPDGSIPEDLVGPGVDIDAMDQPRQDGQKGTRFCAVQ